MEGYFLLRLKPSIYFDHPKCVKIVAVVVRLPSLTRLLLPLSRCASSPWLPFTLRLSAFTRIEKPPSHLGPLISFSNSPLLVEIPSHGPFPRWILPSRFLERSPRTV